MIINGKEHFVNQQINEEEYQLRLEKLTDKDVAVFEELGNVPIENVPIDAFVVILCIDGKATCKMEEREFHLEKNDMLFTHPNQFVQSAMVSYDFKCRGMIMSPSYFESIFMLSGNLWDTSIAIKENPLFHLNQQETDNFLLNFTLIKHKLATTELPHHEQIVKLMLQSLLYEFYDNISPLIINHMDKRSYTSAELLFKHFISLLSADSPHRHDVAYYADKLCITPKYLSSICKKQSQKTASEIINGMTINYIKQMLITSDKTIKQIASETGFDNLSFFGKYVKRELGMSPREFRQNGK